MRYYGHAKEPPADDGILAPNHHNMLSSLVLEHKITVRNRKLSRFFEKLAEMYKDAALDDLDEWRSYAFAQIAGKLRNLDFEVINNRGTLEKLKGVKGFVKSVMRKICEFLSTGSCQRLEEFKSDPIRVGIANIMKIWGMDRSKALELTRHNFITIDDVRNGIGTGDIELSRNARIGVECYEDFSENINRDEIRKIGDIVQVVSKEILPSIEVTILGSYRRGCDTSGNVDILITHPAHFDSVPQGKLGQIIKQLYDRNHLIYHLNHVQGIVTDSTDFREDDTVERNRLKGIDTYMGVFASPVYPKKRRKIGIKFYPYRQKAFASLYFTGNGFFNKSMKLWARAVKLMTLNDQGLYHSTGVSVSAQTEEDIFKTLDLSYRQPNDRDSVDPKVADIVNEMSLDEMEQSGGSIMKWVD